MANFGIYDTTNPGSSLYQQLAQLKADKAYLSAEVLRLREALRLANEDVDKLRQQNAKYRAMLKLDHDPKSVTHYP